MIDGFLGFTPGTDGFRLDPRLPSAWPSLTMDRIRWHDMVLEVKAAKDSIEIRRGEDAPSGPCFIGLPKGEWKVTYIRSNGKEREAWAEKRASDGAYEVYWAGVDAVRFSR